MEKQPYTTPELVELGDVIEITQASLVGPFIDFQGTNPGGPVQTDNIV